MLRILLSGAVIVTSLAASPAALAQLNRGEAALAREGVRGAAHLLRGWLGHEFRKAERAQVIQAKKDILRLKGQERRRFVRLVQNHQLKMAERSDKRKLQLLQKLIRLAQTGNNSGGAGIQLRGGGGNPSRQGAPIMRPSQMTQRVVAQPNTARVLRNAGAPRGTGSSRARRAHPRQQRMPDTARPQKQSHSC